MSVGTLASVRKHSCWALADVGLTRTPAPDPYSVRPAAAKPRPSSGTRGLARSCRRGSSTRLQTEPRSARRWPARSQPCGLHDDAAGTRVGDVLKRNRQVGEHLVPLAYIGAHRVTSDDRAVIIRGTLGGSVIDVLRPHVLVPEVERILGEGHLLGPRLCKLHVGLAHGAQPVRESCRRRSPTWRPPRSPATSPTRQPHGFEGLGLRAEVLPANDLAVAELEYARPGRIRLDAAAPRPNVDRRAPDRNPLAEIELLVSLLEPLEDLLGVRDESLDTFDPAVWPPPSLIDAAGTPRRGDSTLGHSRRSSLPRFLTPIARRTRSTFSCDIAYPPTRYSSSW